MPVRQNGALPPATRSVVAGSAALAALAVGVRLLGVPGPAGATQAQVSSVRYLPNVVSEGYTATLDATAPARTDGARTGRPGRPLGIVGFGESTIELQSLASRAIRANVELHSTTGFDDVTASLDLAAGGMASVPVHGMRGITFCNYALVMTSEGPVEVLAHTEWDGGGEAAYEAPAPATAVVLPLMARDVYSHTSLIWMQNTDDQRASEVVLELFENSGALIRSATFGLEPRESGRIDLDYQYEFEGLPINAGTGFLGSLHLTADRPVAVMAYGDEPLGRGAAAVAARPIADAATEQVLPFVRQSSTASSLIAVANVTAQALEVTVSYRGAASSPAGAGQTVEQTFGIGPRSHAFVDLDLRMHRGNRPAPSLSSGGFLGSAVVRASWPVLTTVLDQALAPGPLPADVLSSMAYNGFGPVDLSSSFVIPRARDRIDGRTTRVVVQNPAAAPVAVTVGLRDERGVALGSPGQLVVPAADAASFTVALPSPGVAQVLLSASAPVAVLVLEAATDADWSAYWAVKMPVALIDVPTPAAPPTATNTRVPPTPTKTPTATRTPLPNPVGVLYLPVTERSRR